MVMLCFKVLLNILFGGWIEICLLVLLYDIYVYNGNDYFIKFFI